MTSSEAMDIVQIMECESCRAAALVTGSAAALSTLLAEEFVYTHASGKADGRSAYLDLIGSGAAKYRSLETFETCTHSYGTAAVMTGRITVVVEHAGVIKYLHNRFTAVWVRRQPSWQLVAWQVTAIPTAAF